MLNSSKHILHSSAQDSMVETQQTIAVKNLYIESYGCAMNFSDSEIIASILSVHGYTIINKEEEADVIFLNTCAIRDNAEQRIRQRLKHLKGNKRRNKELIVGVLGCMAERLKDQLLEEEKLVDIVVGPDAYRELPKLIAEVEMGQRAINVLLSKEETYGEINPIRLNTNGINAFVSIMRGCDNMCAFCVVPFTRGRERSRSPESIVAEVQNLDKNGYKEVTLLGQNVDSYLWFGGGPKKDFRQLTTQEQESSISFAMLLSLVAQAAPQMRIRFSTSHPKDLQQDVLETMKAHDNICKHIHLPAQSGSNRILHLMNRGYTAEWYLQKIADIKMIMPECSISGDIITGFCTETTEDHLATLRLIEQCEFNFSFMYSYSERPGTMAAKKMPDDVDNATKALRLTEIIASQQKMSLFNNQKQIGKTVKVLVESVSKKSQTDWQGRTEQNIMCVFPKGNHKPGDFIKVKIESCTSGTLLCKLV